MQNHQKKSGDSVHVVDTDDSLLDEVLEEVEDGSESPEQKHKLVNEFLRRLEADPAVANPASQEPTFTIADLLYRTNYAIKKEYVFDFKSNQYLPSEDKPVIDLAEVLNMILKEKGLEYTFEDVMKHILAGGDVSSFLIQAHLTEK